MISQQAYARYAHTVRAAYASLGLAAKLDDQGLFLPAHAEFAALPRDRALALGAQAIRQRVALFDATLDAQLLDAPFLRRVWFHNREAFIPILNQEGRDWYAESSFLNFDFMVENFVGMHAGARTIYDLGGHQGVWALFYAMAVGEAGRVHSFEPSVINIECSALSFLLNDVANVVNVPAGIGARSAALGPTEEGLLVAGIGHTVNLLRLDQVFWEPPDFVKIDIEGFEYELLRSFPLFDFCRNVHLELHVPHLRNRGLDWRDVWRLVPFDRVTVRRWAGLQLAEVGPDDELDGYCSLLITPKG